MPRLSETVGPWFRPIFHLGNNYVTMAGAAITTAAALTMIGFWLFEAVSPRPVHPYAGILALLILPGVFVAGLVLIPIGALWRRRQLRLAGQLPTEYPKIDFAQDTLRRAAVLVSGATVLNVALLATASYRGVEYMDSSQFCGRACHEVMQPEYAAYLGSPHSRVECVECHIGPGASWFVKSKLSGARQVLAVAFNTHSRPIASPVHDLRPSRDTCEQCHWPEKFLGDKLIVRTRYQEDEKNTALHSVLVLKLGGERAGGATGIHGRHLQGGGRVHYEATDERRQQIGRITWVDDKGQSVVFEDPEAPKGEAKESRLMDCVDCHNRPTHAFDMPDTALDKALTDGRVSKALPWIKKKGVEILKAEYASQEDAAQKIPAAVAAFYQKEHPEVWAQRRAEVEAAGQGIAAIHARYVFPTMKLTWGSHPNNVGHRDFPGCFRCHDDKHRSADGRVVTQDCESCHAVLALEEEDPKILTDLGLR